MSTATIEKPDKPLTLKQELFCQAILRGLTQSDAYREAYDAKGMTAKTINENASRLIHGGKVAARVASLRAPVQTLLEKKLGITAERVAEELAAIGFANPHDLVPALRSGDLTGLSREQAAALTVEATMTEDGTQLKLKMSDKRAALVDLGKYLGMFKGDGDQAAGPVNLTQYNMTVQFVSKA